MRRRSSSTKHQPVVPSTPHQQHQHHHPELNSSLLLTFLEELRLNLRSLRKMKLLRYLRSLLRSFRFLPRHSKRSTSEAASVSGPPHTIFIEDAKLLQSVRTNMLSQGYFLDVDVDATETSEMDSCSAMTFASTAERGYDLKRRNVTTLLFVAMVLAAAYSGWMQEEDAMLED